VGKTCSAQDGNKKAHNILKVKFQGNDLDLGDFDRIILKWALKTL
jgi:hypothetical protein